MLVTTSLTSRATRQSIFGTLNSILGRVRLETAAGEDTLNISDFGDTTGDTFTIANIGGPGPARTAVDFNGTIGQ